MNAVIRRIGSGLRHGLGTVLVELTAFYRATISAVTPASCRFHPTCSAYAIEAIKIHGPFRGTGLAILRILRCNPWGPFGEDPVPTCNDRHSQANDPADNTTHELQNRIRTS